MPHSDPKVSVLDDQVFHNSKNSSLYLVSARTPFLPCVDLLEWIIHHVNAKKCLLNNEDGECIGVFLLTKVRIYYKLKEAQVGLKKYFMVALYE